MSYLTFRPDRIFKNDDLTFHYADTGGDGQPLIALHGHWMESITFSHLASTLSPKWRVIAFDQRGHGYSDHAKSYTREDYIGDIEKLFEHLHIEKAVLLGHSLGGVNAYQYAARQPQRVRSLIIEDIGTVIDADTSFCLAWRGVFPTREALAERIGPRLLPYVLDSFRQTQKGWRLAFDPQDMLASQLQLNGDHTDDWTATHFPGLLIRGKDSRLTTQAHLEEIAKRRPNTRLQTLEGGHVVHLDNPDGFENAVQEFINEL
jgi:pimeloyl-ACP methyl ester carboxylesterase